jgi:hypothetical protein
MKQFNKFKLWEESYDFHYNYGKRGSVNNNCFFNLVNDEQGITKDYYLLNPHGLKQDTTLKKSKHLCLIVYFLSLSPHKVHFMNSFKVEEKPHTCHT